MTSDAKDALEKLKARLAEPDGRDAALVMLDRIGVRPELIEAIRISGAPAADLLITAITNELDPKPEPLQAGVYGYKDGFYLLLGLARDHATGEERVAYIPLAVKSKWNGTARIALRTPEDFRANFKFIDERHPNIADSGCADVFGCDPSYSCFSDPSKCSKRPKP